MRERIVYTGLQDISTGHFPRDISPDMTPRLMKGTFYK